MKAFTMTILAVSVVLAPSSVLANTKAESPRLVVGGRNSPRYVAPAPAVSHTDVAKVQPVKRTEVLAGGRNAPHQLKTPIKEFQVAPAVRIRK